jgi:hypothetical protein
MADEFNALIKQFSPPVQKLARSTRAFIKAEMPGAVEQVKMGWKAVWYGTTPSMKDIVLAIHIPGNYLNVEFATGTSLPDPEKLLEGTGKNLRHVKVRDAAILTRPAFVALVRAAVAAGTRPSRAR